MQIAILGRQPSISLAELESLFGSNKITQLSSNVATVDITTPLPQSRLGGTVKSGYVIHRLKSHNIDDAYEYINSNIVQWTDTYVPSGKVKLGISIYGAKYSNRTMFNNNLDIKKILKSSGRSVRIIENRQESLNAAQVLNNKLQRQGLEIIIIKHTSGIILAKTTGVQDIDAYAKRDQGRPMRDAKIGMLPPKLAQIIINLAKPKNNASILDPFCGTGVLLQEAMLMGYSVFGTDINPRMIEYSSDNLAWLVKNYDIQKSIYDLSIGDATSASWRPIPDTIACETYLGDPLTSLPNRQKFDKIISQCDQIHHQFLKNLSRQIKPKARLCLAVPAWKTKNSFLHLKTLDYLEELGYTRISFVHAKQSDLIYHRPDQTVARELVVLEKR